MTFDRTRGRLFNCVTRLFRFVTGYNVGRIESVQRFPRVYAILRWVFGVIIGKQTLDREIVAGPLKGYRMVLGPHDRNLYLVGQYEPAITDLFLNELCKPGMGILDVGANLGFYTLLFSSLVGTQGRVYALEPYPQNANKIREMIRINRLANVSFFPVAAADYTGIVNFQTEPTGAMGHIVGGASQNRANVVRVSSIRIDDLVRENGIDRIDLVKIDVEGSECQVLQGMRDVMLRYKPLIIWPPR